MILASNVSLRSETISQRPFPSFPIKPHLKSTKKRGTLKTFDIVWPKRPN